MKSHSILKNPLFIALLCLVGLIPNRLLAFQDTTNVGVFITAIYDLDYADNSFSVHFLSWRLNKLREFKEYNLYEPTNVKEIRTVFSSTQWKDQSENVLPKGLDTTFWDLEDFKAIFNHDYDISNYPFDKEVLSLDFVSAYYYDNWVKLNFDSQRSGLDHEIKLSGWSIGKMEVEKIGKVYNTTFGSPGDTRDHIYPGFRLLIPIQRDGWLLFFKLFAGLAAAFTIALFSLKINITEADGRFGVCVGALFAALANMYIVNSNLPAVSRFSFMDKIHMIGIALILLLFIASIYSLKAYKKDRINRSRKIDTISFWSALAVFILLNTVFLVAAVNS